MTPLGWLLLSALVLLVVPGLYFAAVRYYERRWQADFLEPPQPQRGKR
ncbi:MAG: hypothetical protein ACQGVC_18055 [Myxococcota bacterium]